MIKHDISKFVITKRTNFLLICPILLINALSTTIIPLITITIIDLLTLFELGTTKVTFHIHLVTRFMF